MKKLLLALVLGITGLPGAMANIEAELLPPERAFSVRAEVVDPGMVRVTWTIADSYYMYRDKFRFKSETAGIRLGTAIIPPGKKKKDEFFGEVETYRKSVAVDLPVERDAGAPSAMQLTVISQGCSDIGVCYPPLTQKLTVSLPIAAAPPRAAGPLGKLTALGNRLGLGGQKEPEFLPPDEAFAFNTEVLDSDSLRASWVIAEGYYLYRDKFDFKLEDSKGFRLGGVSLPPGKVKEDQFIGRTEVYYNGVDVVVPLIRTRATASAVNMKVTYQGCSNAGLCYPPETKTVSLTMPPGSADSPASAGMQSLFGAKSTLTSKTILLALLGAFGVGLLLTFTPCVLPLIPILSSIIVGQGGENITKTRGGMLSVSYVLGTALTYTAAGVLAGLTGDQLQAYFQNAWAIGILSVILMSLALSMFGFYELQMPAFIQTRLQARMQRFTGGSFIGVFLMGTISALIVGACVSPLLITVLSLAIVSQDPLLGGAIMFSMALGMGVVLIAIGVGAGYLLPKAGDWMDSVKGVFGVMLIGVAIYLLGILPEVPVLFLWGALFIIVSVYLGATQSIPVGESGWRYLWKGVGMVSLIWGILALLGGMTGNRDILRPLPMDFTGGNVIMAAGGSTVQARISESPEVFERVATLQLLESRMEEARNTGKPVIVDFYATWCTDCLRMEKGTFSNPQVQEIMRREFVSLQVDLTDPNDPEGKAIKKRFNVFGPPALLFFSATGEPLSQLNFYGYKTASEFLKVLNRATG